MSKEATSRFVPRTRKVRILATLGPASDSPAMIRRLVEAGADAFRINMSHGSHADHEKRIAANSGTFDAWSPWLMLMRKASAPASISARIISGVEEDGPSVARIFTFRARGLSMRPAIAAVTGRSTGLRRGEPSPSGATFTKFPTRFERAEIT